MPKLADYIFRLVDVLLSEVTNGEVRLNVGDKTEGLGEAVKVPHLGTDGFVSRPNDPDENGACIALVACEGNQKFSIGQCDNRYASKTGALEPGDRAIVSKGEARFLLKNADDALTLYTANADDGGTTQTIDLNGSTGTTLILNGKSFIEIKKDGISIVCGAAGITLSADGTIQMFGGHCAINTSGGNLGVIGVVPPPPGITSIMCGPTGLAAVPCKSWTINPA